MNTKHLQSTLRNMTSTQGQPLLTRVDIVSDLHNWKRRAGAAAIVQDSGGCCGVFLSSPGSDVAAAVQQSIAETLSQKYDVDVTSGTLLISDPNIHQKTTGVRVGEPQIGGDHNATAEKENDPGRKS